MDRRGRAVPYSVPTVLLSEYLRHGATLSRGPGRWSCGSRAATRRPGDVVDLVEDGELCWQLTLAVLHSYHAAPCSTDLARIGWELHAIATFAGLRSSESTLQFRKANELCWQTRHSPACHR